MPDEALAPVEKELDEVSALAVRAKDDPALMAELWDGVKYFVRLSAYKYISRAYAWQGQSTRHFDADDLIQSGYLALVDAVKGYDPERGAFITYLGFYIRNRFAEVAGRRGTKRRPEFEADSLDTPIGEDGDTSMGAMLADPNAEFADDITEREALKQDCAALLTEIDELPKRQRQVLMLTVRDGLSLEAAAEVMGGISRQAANEIRNKAIEKIKFSPTGLRISADRYHKIQLGPYTCKINCEADKHHLCMWLKSRGMFTKTYLRFLQEAGWDQE